MAGDPGAPIRVLIADDDHRVRTALAALLAGSAGFGVVGPCATTDNALTLARQHRPTVALVDLLIPEADDGLALLRAIDDELQIPTIAMSMNGGLRNSALVAGATAFFDKSGTADLLLAALRAAAA